MLEAISIAGIIKAKVSGVIPPNATRALLPQPCFLQVLHACPTQRIRKRLEDRMAELGCRQFILAGTAGHQRVDIMGALQHVQELNCDNGSQRSIAQADIAKYYDTVCPLAMARSLIQHGVEEADARFAARMRIGPTIALSIGDSAKKVSGRIGAF
jgi:hypothetical protein